MVLDLNLFRIEKGGDPDRIRVSMADRFKDTSLVDEVVKLDREWKTCRHDIDNLNNTKNNIAKKYRNIKSNNIHTSVEFKDLTQDLNKQSVSVTNQLEPMVKKLKHLETHRNDTLRKIGNILHPDVPIFNSEDDNSIIRTDSDTGLRKKYSHIDLIHMIGGINFKKGSVVAGSGCYFLTGPGVWLQQALVGYALQFAAEKGYEPVYTPFWMTRSCMAEVVQLSQFDEDLYELGDLSKKIDDPKYLISTPEQPLTALHTKESFNSKQLPVRHVAISTCFQRKRGPHCGDTDCAFCVRQFEKVEQFVLTSPEESWKAFHEMVGTSESFYKSLGIPFRIVSVVSGKLDNATSMEYDLEGWFPGSESFLKLVAVSNYTDYLSRNLLIRYRKKEPGGPEFVHMVKGTLCTVIRAVCAILEVYQVEDGIRVPEVLSRFMPLPYHNFIPFVNKPPGPRHS